MASADRSGLRFTLGTFILAAVIPIVILVGVAFARVAVADYAIHRQKDALQQDIAGLKHENDQLRARVEYLNSDRGIELLAREDLGWVRPGDTAVIVVDDPSGSVSPGALKATPTVPPTAR